jgi:hypothetical protein
MADYLYQVRVYVDISLVPRGGGGATLGPSGPDGQLTGAPALGFAQSNVPGYGPTWTPGIVPMGQTKRYQQAEMVPNAIATPPTVANIVTALTSAANDLGGQITTADLATIQNWALGQQ